MVDGYFGSLTREAVKVFQASKGLPADGIVGSYTWREILALSLPEVPPLPLPVEDVFRGIKATVFGGDAEVERSAYDNHRITQSELAVALPYRFTGTRPKVEVTANGKTAVATIEDIGPWLTDDPYWVTHTRPLAETSWKQHTSLLRGPNKGRVANGGGIDLSPGLAKALGINGGDGLVDWRFV
jgi:peptidoglycan hydrolase-like protein with peptidoglycan-binding domain